MALPSNAVIVLRRATRCAAVLCLAPSLGAQIPLPSGAAPAPLAYDSTTVRTVLADAVASVRAVGAGPRLALLTAIGNSQVAARDFGGAEQTLVLTTALESSGTVMPDLGELEVFAGFERAGLARRLTCGLRVAGRPDAALAVVRRMPAGETREWELAHAVSLLARGAISRRSNGAASSAESVDRWNAAITLSRDVALPAARLDALLAIALAIPDSASGQGALARAYAEARAITLADVDRQRSRDALLAGVALRLGKGSDARMLFARLSNAYDLQQVLAAAAGEHERPLVRELAPRVVQGGRAITDSAARDFFLTQLWKTLERGGGRSYADSLLPEATARAERPNDLPAALDSADKADPAPAASAKRALEARDFAEARRQIERVPLDDREARRAELLVELASAAYGADRDTARAYLREARAALLAVPRDSATFDDVASRIAERQLWVGGDDDEAVKTLDLVRSLEHVEYALRQWGESRLSRMTARTLRGYADRVHRPATRDAILARLVSAYLTAPKASDADRALGRALADSIASPWPRRQALRAVANDALRRGDSTEARRILLVPLRDPTPALLLREVSPYQSVAGDLVRAGGWREAVAWARSPSDPVLRARRLLTVAAALQQQLDMRSGYPIFISNGPDWCRDEF